MEKNSGTPKTLGWHYKRRGSQQRNSSSNSESEGKDPLKNSFRIQKERREGKHRPGS